MPQPELRLDDAPEGAVCLSCCNVLTAGIERCADCGRALRPVASVRGRFTAAGVLVRVRIVPPDDAHAIRTALVGAEVPYLEYAPDPEPAEDASPLVSFFIARKHLEAAETALASGHPSAMRRHVAHASDEFEAASVRAWLGEAGIPFEEEQFTPMYGFRVGELAGTVFTVFSEDAEKADAVLDSHRFEVDREDPAGRPADTARTEDSAEDVAAMRVERRAKVARFFLALAVVAHFVLAAVQLLGALPLFAIVSAFVGFVYLRLHDRTREDPFRAFAAAFLLSSAETVVVFGIFWGALGAVPIAAVLGGLLTVLATLNAARGFQPQENGTGGTAQVRGA